MSLLSPQEALVELGQVSLDISGFAMMSRTDALDVQMNQNPHLAELVASLAAIFGNDISSILTCLSAPSRVYYDAQANTLKYD